MKRLTLSALILAVACGGGSSDKPAPPPSATTFRLTQMVNAVAGVGVSFKVAAVDTSGAVNASYRGTVEFATDDTRSATPGDVTFSPADGGQITATVVFKTAGPRTFVVADKAAPSAIGIAHVTVQPGAAVRLSLSGLPATVVAGQPVALGVTTFDPYDNVATSFTSAVHFASTDPGAQLPPDPTFSAADVGSRTFEVVLTKAGTPSVTVSSAGLAPATALVAVTSAQAANVTLEGLPLQLPVDVIQNVTATVRDVFGNPATDYAGILHFTNSDRGAPAIPDLPFSPVDLGTKVVAVQFATAGQQSLAAADTLTPSIATSIPAVTQVVHGPAASLVVTGIPASTVAGTPLTAIVTAVDKHGNVVTDFASTVHLASTDPKAALPPDFTFTAADLGTHPFPIVLVSAATSRVMIVSSAGLPMVTANVAVVDAGAAQVTLEGLPTQVATDAIQSITVRVRDAFGNIVTGYVGTLHFTNTDLQATPIPDTTFTPADLGTKVVTVQFGTAGPQKVTATETLNPSITGFRSTQVIAGPAGALLLTGLPPSTTAGTTLSATVIAVDNHGNVATDFAGTVHFSSTDPNAALTGDYVFTPADFGSHTFQVVFTKAGNSSLTVSSPGFAAATVNVVVSPAAATRVTLEGLPAQVVVDASQNVTATVRDPFGNPVTGYTGTLQFTRSDPQATAIPDAAFGPLDLGAKVVTIQFGTAGLQSVSAHDSLTASIAGSASTIVLHGPAARLVLSGIPGSTVAGTQLPATVAVVDAHGNPATDFTGTVHFASSDPGAQLPADFAFAAPNPGSRTFPVVLTRAMTSTVTVSSPNLPSATASVVVAPAGAARVTLEGLPGQVVVDLPQSLTVTVRDRFGNAATDYAGTLHFTSDDPQAPPIPDAKFVPTDLGVKVVAVSFATAGLRTVSAADSVAPSIAGSASTQVVHGPAAQLLLAGIPTSTVAGTFLIATVKVVDGHGNLATDFSGTVHFESTDPNAQLPVDYVFTGADLGLHQFTVELVRAGTSSVTVSSTGLQAATSTVAVGNAPAAQLTLEGLPPQVVVDAVQSVTVTVRDPFGNPVPDYTGIIHFTSSDPLASIPDTTFTATDLGTKVVSVRFAKAGTQTVTAKDTARPSIVGSASTLVVHGPAVALTLAGISATTVAGTLLPVTVTAVDTHANLVTDFNGTVHFSSTDPNANLPLDGAFAPSDGGVRSFSVALTTAGSRSVSVSQVGGTVAGATATVTVSNAPASRVTLDAHAAQVAVDTNAVFTVTIRDRFGNPALDYGGTVHFISSDLRATSIQDVTFTPTMFATIDVTLQFATAGDHSLIATDTVDSKITGSAVIKVTNGPAAAYALSALPIAAVAGEPLPLTITATDAHGNAVLSYAGSAAVTSADPSDRLPVAGTFVAGVRSVSLAFVTSGQHHATVSEVGGLIRADTSVVGIVSGSASILVLTDASSTAGTPATTNVVAKDAFGNVVVSYRGTVALTSTDPQAVLPPSYTFVQADAGQHALAVTLKTAGPWSVTATDAAGPLSGSAAFTVTPAAGASCGLGVIGKAGAQVAVRVRVSDAFANLATGYTGTITFSSTDTQATLPPPATYTAATDHGSRDFTAVLPTPGDQSIRATDTASSFSCQANVSIVTAQFFAVTFTGTEAWAGTPRPATVQAQDANGSPLINYAGTIAFSSSDPLASLPASVTLLGTEGGRATVNVTFKTIGLQTFTAKETVNATRTGTAFQLVHGLSYTDPPAGGKVRLILNAASTASVVQLDLVSNASLFPLGVADPLTGLLLPSSARNGAFGAGMNLPLDGSKVGPDTQLLVLAPPATAILNLGAAPQAIGAALANSVLYSGISQKRFDLTLSCRLPCTNDHLRGDVQARPFPSTNSLYYSLRLKLTPNAVPGTVFDGQALASNTKFRAAVRDRSGSDVFSGTADFAIGRLEVK